MIGLIIEKIVFCGDHSEKIEQVALIDNPAEVTVMDLINQYDLIGGHSRLGDYVVNIKITQQI